MLETILYSTVIYELCLRADGCGVCYDDMGDWLTHYNISWQTKLSSISVAIWTIRTVFTGHRKPLATSKRSMVRRWIQEEFYAHLIIWASGLLFPERQCYIQHFMMGNGLLAHIFWWRQRSARGCGMHHLHTYHETFTFRQQGTKGLA
jgi:hypothetical protein